ncbi:MAG: division/cell wall cluster transcriptional repressor MraZ [Thermoguttaceae bacterium]|nr:division/cell wall cluster transcriptional repressor MraZ [Thermoguttaceae bacterium]MBQ3332280.1 division/cell wall cluster transcriptional repressor MraZ [Thermoguttaceae bacterium]MBQ6620218.1 division/cell wall cluster transcriptional repressor MraZ [Thermoguttaceae bacterium]
MAKTDGLILGEFSRKLDERYRLSLPLELLGAFRPGTSADGSSAVDTFDCILAKERPGCVSVWSSSTWQERMANDVEIIARKYQNGYLNQSIPQLQVLGRLLSTRQRPVQLVKGRLLVPEGFREFLRVEPKGEVMVVGAAVCVEIWNPQQWIQYTETTMASFQETFAQLAG